MSSVKLDLDFQDYTPTADNNEANAQALPNQEKTQSTRPEIQIRIPTAGQASNSNQNSILQTVLHNVTASGMSDDAIRQLVLANDKQRQQQQRDLRSTGGNWGLSYFAQYFDVTTSEVLQRILWSVIPIRKTGVDIDDLNDSELVAPLTSMMESDMDSPAGMRSDLNSENMSSLSKGRQKSYSYVERFIQSRPDLYGPFWISATLVFAVAILSNIVSYSNFISKLDITSQLLSKDKHNSTSYSNLVIDDQQSLNGWHYSMDELNTMASVVMSYVTIVPTFFWFLFWFRGCAKYYTLAETICAYGYSLSIFIPLAILLMIQSILFRYLALSIAAILSGLVLTLSFVPIVKSDPNPASSHIILAIVPACQFGLAYVLHRIMLVQ